MIRSVLASLAVTVMLPLGAAAPAAAVERYDPMEGLSVHPEWGSVTGHRAVLRRSCHTYSYSYAIAPPDGTWALEIFIQGPGHHHLAGGAFLDGYDPEVGTGHYTLCRNSTRYGTFTIEGKLSVDDGDGHIVEGRLPADTFRLHRRHRSHH